MLWILFYYSEQHNQTFWPYVFLAQKKRVLQNSERSLSLCQCSISSPLIVDFALAIYFFSVKVEFSSTKLQIFFAPIDLIFWNDAQHCDVINHIDQINYIENKCP